MAEEKSSRAEMSSVRESGKGSLVSSSPAVDYMALRTPRVEELNMLRGPGIDASAISTAFRGAPARWGASPRPSPSHHPATPGVSPILAPTSRPYTLPPDTLPDLDDPEPVKGRLGEFAGNLLGVLLAWVVSVLDNAPYGLVLFPPSLGSEYSAVGVGMVLTAAAISQFIFSIWSGFPTAVGCMVVENLPFLVAMGHAVEKRAALQNYSPGVMLSTCVVLWSLSTLVSGLLMLALGRFKAGRLTAYFPKHVLLGCTAGMGAFIVTAGVSATTGEDWGWSPNSMYAQVSTSPRLFRLSLALLFAALVPAVRTISSSPFVLPAYLLCLPVLFWGVVLAAGWVDTARAEGWFIDIGGGSGDE
eukprot:Hpha_TRINITY_DN12301_c0_g2::TRINITY_DN12301_c0_g2_i1::g.155955::m.155955/K03321/TC.SULP; sulfate permease, SulP family